MSVSILAENYVNTSYMYLENFKKLMKENEPEKAGEVLWGAMAESIRAFAAKDGFQIGSHDELKNFAKEISFNLKYSELWDAFRKAENLHSNFYESRLKIEDVEEIAREIEPVIIRIISLTIK